MAALGKIRQRGVILSCIIGLGIFAFIAGDMFRACESRGTEKRMQVGTVMGEKISQQEFMNLVDEYTDYIKVARMMRQDANYENFSEEELSYIKDQTWSMMISQRMIEEEASKLGLTVTVAEYRSILEQGTDPTLMQLAGMGFANQQTGRFDVNAMNQFISEYEAAKKNGQETGKENQMIYNTCQFVLKQLRSSRLAQKYQALLAGSMLSNPVRAKYAFDGENVESSIKLAYMPYSEISDKDVKISDSDLKAEYDKIKDQFRKLEETRDIKYVDFKVVASEADRKQLKEQLDTMASKLAKADDPAEIIRRSGSMIPYAGIPVTKNAFPEDIKGMLDSISAGTTTKVTENTADNTFNAVRLISKVQLPDSILVRQILVVGKDVKETRGRADSITKALREGADFKILAKKYQQPGDSMMVTTASYERSANIDDDFKTFISTINGAAKGEIKNIEFANRNVIVQVMDRKGMTDKYVAAVIKKSIDFSSDTYSREYNRFSNFVSQCKSISDMEAKAKEAGYDVKELKGRQSVASAGHNIAGISNTTEALRWLYSADKGTISPLYECGSNNDQLLVLSLERVHEQGFEAWDSEDVKEILKARVLRNKKSEMLVKKLAGAASIEAAQKAGAKVADIDKITFGSSTYVAQTGAAEPALSGRVAATAKGAFSKTPVIGNGGVYMFQVTDRKELGKSYDEKSYSDKTRGGYFQRIDELMNVLYEKAGVEDHRYLFF